MREILCTLLIFVLVNPVIAVAGEPRSVELCELVQHAATYQHQTVRVRGRIVSDCYHGSVLVDRYNRCSNGPALYVPQGVNDEAMAAVCVLSPTSIPWKNKVTATVTGTFELMPHEIPTWTLEATAMTDVVIKRPER